MVINFNDYRDCLDIDKIRNLIGIVLTGTPALEEDYGIDFKASSDKIVIRLSKSSDFNSIEEFIVNVLSMGYIKAGKVELPASFEHKEYQCEKMKPSSFVKTVNGWSKVFSHHLIHDREMMFLHDIFGFTLNLKGLKKAYINDDSTLIQLWSEHDDFYLSINMWPLD